MITIYGVFDPSKGAIVYVGQSGNIKNRTSSHKSRFPGCTVIILAVVEKSVASEEERKWIQKYISNDCLLENRLVDKIDSHVIVSYRETSERKAETKAIAESIGLDLASFVRNATAKEIEEIKRGRRL